jgi:hypothetical protein
MYFCKHIWEVKYVSVSQRTTLGYNWFSPCGDISNASYSFFVPKEPLWSSLKRYLGEPMWSPKVESSFPISSLMESWYFSWQGSTTLPSHVPFGD